MKYLTFLDYPMLEATGTSFKAKLREKDREIEQLKQQMKQQDAVKEDAIRLLSDQMQQLMSKVKELENNQQQSH